MRRRATGNDAPRGRSALLVLCVAAIACACGGLDEDATGEPGPAGGGAAGTTGGAAGAGAGGSGGGAGAGGVIDAAGGGDGQTETGAIDADASKDGAGGAAPCTTRITYGSAWMHPPGHPEDFDVAPGQVGWDGKCAQEGSNAFALLSNGWKPYFAGHGSCVVSLVYQSCPGAPAACATRVSYGPGWLPAPNHPAFYDDVPGVVYWGGVCRPDGGNSYGILSNGWAPHFSGTDACDLSFRYVACGALYANAVLDTDCPDPGVLRDGAQYVMACTSGNAPDAFPIRVSPDLVHWQSKGHILPAASKPAWAKSDFWAPEVHRVGNAYVAYFTARHQDGRLSVGAATAVSATGPFAAAAQPLLHDAAMGLIDATFFEAPDAKRYLVWKEDGNAVGKPTPIHGQELAPSGLALVGARVTLMTNDQGWEGKVVEGPWMIHHGGQYYLFYSGNSYASSAYAIGVARASAPLGPYTKAAAPIVKSAGAWAGPGHGSVLDAPSGQTWFVYHSWKTGQVNGPGDGRVVLLDRVGWDGGWPSMLAAPSSPSSPIP